MGFGYNILGEEVCHNVMGAWVGATALETFVDYTILENGGLNILHK